MHKSKKLAIVGFSGLSGATQVGINYLKGLDIPKDEVMFIFYGKTPEINPGYTTELKELGIATRFARKTGGVFDPRSEKQVFRYLKEHQPENIFLVSAAPFAGVLAYKLLNPKVNVISIEQHPLALTSFKEYLLAYISLTFYNHVVPASEPYAAGYREKMKPFSQVFGKKIVVIPNGVEIPADETLFFNGLEPGKPLTIGMAARFDAVKDYDTVVAAFHQLQQKGTGKYVLRLAGDGPNRPRIEQLVKDLGLTDSVEFLGLINKQEMEAFYRSLDLYVQSTQGEVMSFSMIEAMGHAKTFLGTRVRGVQEFIRDGENGLLFEYGNADDLAQKIEELYQNPLRLAQLSRGARAHYDQYFSLPSMVRAYSKLMTWGKA